jgi:hypothetical protein
MSHATAHVPPRAPRDALARVGLELPAPLSAVGRVGAEVDLALAQRCAQRAALHLLFDVLGEAGHHARSAFGVVCLPFGSPVELDAVVADKTS